MTHHAEISAIEKAVQTYLDGLYEGDADKLATVFHPASALTTLLDGKVVVTPRDQWLEAVRNRPSPKKTGLPRHDHVLAIDIVGPALAQVKLNCAIPPRFFTDELAMMKVDGRWQVAQKVFMTELRG